MEDLYPFLQHDVSAAPAPCPRDIPASIRGFPLPPDYRELMARQDGAHLVFDRSALDLDEVHIVLFSLQDIIDGSCYRDSFGGYLGSELTMREDFQNVPLGIRTTANDTPYDLAPKLFQQFYRDYLVIGYVWAYWEEPIRYIQLLGVDKDGAYIIARDWGIEWGSPVGWRGASLRALLEEARSI